MDKVIDDTKQVIDKKEGGDVKEEKPQGNDVVDDDALETDVKDTDVDDDLTDDDLTDDDKISEAQDRVQDILDKFGYDSLEELEADHDSLKELQDTIGTRDANKLIEDAEYLMRVKEFWAEQDEAKKRDTETHDETIARLEREKKATEQKLKDRDKADAKKREQKEQQAQAKKMLKSFNSTVVGEIDNIKDLPKEYKPFLKTFLGVENPMNEINIGVKPEVRKTAKNLIKDFRNFEQIVIKRYLDGKIEMPKITPSPVTPVSSEKQPKNLAEARSFLRDAFGVKS